MYIDELEKSLREFGEAEEDINAAKKYAENLLQLNLPVIFDRVHFSLLQGRDVTEISKMTATLEEFYYRQMSIPKKTGGDRVLDVPNPNIRLIQKWILKHILYKIPISQYANGFCKNRSIKTNAEKHIGMECVINVDLKDFFPSIRQKQIFRIFYYYGYTIQVSHLLARLCTYNGYLPQGAVTSPYLSNIVCLKLDKRLGGLAKKYNAYYTRYADDITFSGNKNISRMLPVVEKIIRDEGFTVNEAKTRVQYNYDRQEVTGLIVNGGKVHVNRQYLKKLKQEIYYCRKYGPSNHMQHEKIKKLNFRDHLYGKAYFVKMIDAELGIKLIRELNEVDWER